MLSNVSLNELMVAINAGYDVPLEIMLSASGVTLEELMN